MTKTLKQLLHSIATLPSSDQQWILRRLPSAQKIKFETLCGIQLLQEAQHFRDIHQPPLVQINTLKPTLPSICEQLKTRSPLYIAIILEQGLYPWETAFLQQVDQDGMIQAAKTYQVLEIKPLVKQALLSEWERLITFESYLEDPHG